jgi:cobaltochelatase CobS
MDTIPSIADLEAAGILTNGTSRKRKAPTSTPTPAPTRQWDTVGGAMAEFIEAIVSDKLATAIGAIAPQVTTLEIKIGDKVQALEGKHHFLMPLVLQLVSSGLNLALVGPTGTGKTSAVVKAAEALGLPIAVQPFSAQSTKAELLGFVDATGSYRPSAFYTRFRDGGIFLADEFDCCNPGLATVLNAAIANRVMTFPNGETVTAHPSFSMVAAMNTLGFGATAEYIGRNRLDAATLNRFVYLQFPADRSLEAAILGVAIEPEPLDLGAGGILTPADLWERYETLKAAIQRHRLPHILTQRDLIAALTLSRLGIGKDWINALIFHRAMTPEQIKQVEG